MPDDRDVAAFDERARSYDQGCLGRLHHEIVTRTIEVALLSQPHPRRILDVGCGTGYLLRLLAGRCRDAVEFAGVDPAVSMVDAARLAADDPRIAFAVGWAEDLPYPDHRFDIVVSTTSFDHWGDQRAGLADCTRVLVENGNLIIADLFSPWLIPTLVRSRKDKARTKARANRLLANVGLRVVAWHDVAPLIRAVVAVLPATARAPALNRKRCP
jgi:ubiquinone/menaquinone biosynthesis C-methylase UbiE